MSNQCNQVLELLKKGPLTAREAQEEIGCQRLAARVKDLKAMGHPIVATTVRAPNRFGKSVNFAQYRLTGTRTPPTIGASLL